MENFIHLETFLERVAAKILKIRFPDQDMNWVYHQLEYVRWDAYKEEWDRYTTPMFKNTHPEVVEELQEAFLEVKERYTRYYFEEIAKAICHFERDMEQRVVEVILPEEVRILFRGEVVDKKWIAPKVLGRDVSKGDFRLVGELERKESLKPISENFIVDLFPSE